VYSNAEHNNEPLVIQTLDDALKAAIELHDLPAPEEREGKYEHKGEEHHAGGGCPLPTLPPGLLGGVSYPDGVADICPAFGSPLSRSNRSDAREVIARYRSLSASDQEAIVEFLKQL
jgi:hypothetical protein